MPAANAGKTRLIARHALAGLQAGTFGFVLFMGWLMLASLLNDRSVWSVPNLFATSFYGANVYRDQLLRGTWSGMALLLVIYGLGGVLWGIVWGDRRKPFAVLYGALAGMLAYYVFFDVIWKVSNPLIMLYAPNRQLEVAHLLWGMSLARSAGYSRRMANLSTELIQTDAGVSSGGATL